jgi:DNA-binding PadR family transcriptional regulator
MGGAKWAEIEQLDLWIVSAHFPGPKHLTSLCGSDIFYLVDYMSTISLGEFEQIVLLAILRLGNSAYGVSIRKEILERTGRTTSPGALYTTLDRLEEKGFVTVRLGNPTPERGGRSKRFFRVTPQGRAVVAAAQRSYQRLLQGIALPGFSKGVADA